MGAGAGVPPPPAVRLLAPATHAVHAGAWGLARSSRAEASLPLVCIAAPLHLALAHGPPLAEPEAVLHEMSEGRLSME